MPSIQDFGRLNWQNWPEAPTFEAIPLIEDNDGNLHWACERVPPFTLVDVHLLPFGQWLKIEEGLGRITITLDGKVVVYERIGRDLHGHWLCGLTRSYPDDGRQGAEPKGPALISAA